VSCKVANFFPCVYLIWTLPPVFVDFCLAASIDSFSHREVVFQVRMLLSTWSERLTAVVAICTSIVPSTAASVQPSKVPEYNTSQVVDAQTLDSPFPYQFPLLGSGNAANSGQFPMPLCHGFKLEEATIDQLQQAMQDGTLTSVKIVTCYLERIGQTDGYLR